MPRLIDVRVRLPKTKLGDFLESLPTWSAQMIGYDLLAAAEGPAAANGKAKPKPRANYKPITHSAADVCLRLLTKQPMNLSEMWAAYKGDKFNGAALQSGFYALRNHGLIRKNADDKYEVVSG
jgi:hypothetical protein